MKDIDAPIPQFVVNKTDWKKPLKLRTASILGKFSCVLLGATYINNIKLSKDNK